MNLVYKNEKPLFTILALISFLLWLVFIVGTVGIALIYVLLGYIFFLFAQSAFIAYLKGTGVKVTKDQYPELYESLINGCNKVGQQTVPDMYLLRTDFFNALATRFLGRHYIVLFTDVLDALEDKPGAIDFYIGHELGHIHRKHLLWAPILFPAMLLPVLGAAYRRAEEYTCDRYGVACCENEDDIRAALATIAAGNTRWKSINVDAYLGQIKDTSGFWMSFNELTGDYPWLTKRLAACIAFKRGGSVKNPRRHFFAWLLSLIIPRTGIPGGGGLVGLMMLVAIIGILAAIALPAYQDYTFRATNTTAYIESTKVSEKVTEYAMANQQWPTSLVDLGYISEELVGLEGKFEIGLYENGMIGANMGEDAKGESKYIVLEPAISDGQITWSCYGENISTKLLPPKCR